MQIKLHITGMTCGGCVKSVNAVLTSLTGVQQVNVSLEGFAEVQFDEHQISVAQLIEAIEDAGFDANA